MRLHERKESYASRKNTTGKSEKGIGIATLMRGQDGNETAEWRQSLVNTVGARIKKEKSRFYWKRGVGGGGRRR